MEINDNESISDAERENRLIQLFAKDGHALYFVDGPAPWLTKSIQVEQCGMTV